MKNPPLLALLSALALPAQAQMHTPGSFRVTESGAAEYRIPIRVPPGIAGVEPKLALVYNSQAGNGLLGMGWNIEGLSAITRCPRTWAQDGLPPGSVNYDSNDRFCLDGQRLMAVNGGVYGAVGTEYRTERESFTKVVSHGGTLGDPAWFEVRTKSGQIMEYGNTTVSRIEAQGKSAARVWAVNKVSDTKGNYLTFTYEEDNAYGDYRPIRIDYTGNSITGAPPANSVRFIQEPETRSDQVPLYVGGSVVQTRYRLAGIHLYQGASLVTDYGIMYDAGGAMGRSRLRSVTECAAGSGCLAPISLGWTSSAFSQFSAAHTTYPSGADYGTPPSNNFGSVIGDFNGDGRTDYLLYANDTRTAYLSNGDGTFNSVFSTVPGGSNFGQPPHNNFSSVTGDFNGDGKTDYLLYAGNTFYVFFSNGDGTFAPVSGQIPNGWNFGQPPASEYSSITGDFNGDGRTDFLIYRESTYWTFLSTGTWFTGASATIPNGMNFGAPPASSFDSVTGDFDGDRRTDFILLANDMRYMFFSNGDGTFSVEGAPAGWNFGQPPRANFDSLVADFNGDGLMDYMLYANGTRYVFLNKGARQFSAVSNDVENGVNFGQPPHNNFDSVAGDFNGDGKTDYMLYAGNAYYMFLSKGDGTFSQTGGAFPPGSNFGQPPHNNFSLISGDLDGDGKDDFVLYGGANQYAMRAQAAGAVDAIESITNSFGDLTSITYKPLTDASVYSKDSGASYPVQDIQAPMYVVSNFVSNFQTSDGMVGATTTHYTYSGLRADVATGRGSLGFRWQEATNQSTGLKIRTEFSQEWPYVGLPFSVMKTHLPSGVVLSQVTSTNYGCINPATSVSCSIVPGNRYFPFVSQSFETSSDLTSAGTVVALPTVTTTTQYDVFGNPTSIAVSTSDGHSKTTTNTFLNNVANWLIGRLTSSTVLSTSP